VLVIVFIEHFQIVSTSSYIAIVNWHTQLFTTARTKSSQSARFSPVVAWQGPQRRTPPIPGPRITPVPQPPAPNCNSPLQSNCSSLTNSPTLNFPALHSLIVLGITSRHGPHRKHRSSNADQLLLSGPHRKHRIQHYSHFPPVTLPSNRTIRNSIITYYIINAELLNCYNLGRNRA
jgi:hypothetical protein